MNLTPFMAVTAHWIEGEEITTPQGPQYKLTLRADLIGFHRVPGCHNGEHLACAFLYVLDQVDIAEKVLQQHYLPLPDSDWFLLDWMGNP